MILQIDETTRIASDPLNWTVERLHGNRKDRKTGESVPNWKALSYHSSLEAALKALHERWLREDPSVVRNADELAQVANALYRRIRSACEAGGERGRADFSEVVR